MYIWSACSYSERWWDTKCEHIVPPRTLNFSTCFLLQRIYYTVTLRFWLYTCETPLKMAIGVSQTSVLLEMNNAEPAVILEALVRQGKPCFPDFDSTIDLVSDPANSMKACKICCLDREWDLVVALILQEVHVAQISKNHCQKVELKGIALVAPC